MKRQDSQRKSRTSSRRQSLAGDVRQQGHGQNDPEHLAGEQDVQSAGVGRHPGRGDEEREDDQAERDPGPTVEALGDLPQPAPGRRRDQEEQPDEDRTLHGDAFLALGGVDRNDPGQERLETIEARYGQRDLPVGVRQKGDLERARQEQGDEDDQEDERGPFQRRFSREYRLGLLLVGRVRTAEDEGHDHPDADAEDERQEEAGEGQVRSDHAARIDQGQDVGRRSEEEEGDRRTEPGALPVDAREQGHDRAGADRENGTGQRGRRIGDVFRGVPAQEAGDRFLRDQGRHGPGDEERGNQAEQDVRGQIRGQVAQAALQEFQHSSRQYP